MELIDRYVYAVTEQLPEDMKEDVRKELRGNIEDMLPDDYTEEDVKAVLEELGNPWKIAEEYQPKKRYLIGPALYSKYFTVLKLVAGIVMTVVAAVTIMGWVFTPLTEGDGPSSYAEMFSELIWVTVQGGLQAALWVTFAFVAIEREWFGITGKIEGVSMTDDPWSVSDLPTIPVQSKKIPRTGTIFSIIFTMLVTAVVYFQPELIGVFIRDSEGFTIYSLLETDRLQAYLPFILLLALFQMILFVWKYIVQYWNLRLWAVHTIASVLISILLIVMANDTALISDAFFNNKLFFEVSLSTVVNQRDIIVRVFAAIVVVITVWDAIDAFLKTRKKAA
ncbi:HAAS signaling domain-containing protein [Paenibacillus camelliae]|uniref:HAAS signaling domain-containing protein n=1 Tax=Paenibacillus camelliae TaxID=512410 RepID=UPI0020406235|nr:hypothetical protein [Paenibacillus camelliae]MCM3633827.1 hypothetical protein [Paenibacillus camelliae]